MKRRRQPKAPPVENRCVRMIGRKDRCPNPGTEFAMNAYYCEAHDPKGDPHCTHSLGKERCSYCGARLSATG